jgi:hypothetical protein
MPEKKLTIQQFLSYADTEISQWQSYAKAKKVREFIKKNIIIGLNQLPDYERSMLITKLLKYQIFTNPEIANGLNIPVQERKLINAQELLTSNIPPEKMIIGRGLLPTSGFILIGGLAKEGKTLLSLQMCISLVTGKHFLDEFPVTKKCKVLYIYYENTLQGLKTILKSQVEGLEKLGLSSKSEELENLHLWDGREFVIDFRETQLAQLKDVVEVIKPDVIFLDPIGQFIAFDINKGENVKKFNGLLRQIRNCAWVLIHHYRKPKADKVEGDVSPIYKLLGSSYLANFCETFIGLEPEGASYPSNYKKIYFVSRRGSEPIPLHLKRGLTDLCYSPIDTIDLLRGKVSQDNLVSLIQSAYNGRASYKDIVNLGSQRFNVSEKRIAQKLIEAREKGLLAKEEGKRGRWYVTA